jgi:hypothetical protein
MKREGTLAEHSAFLWEEGHYSLQEGPDVAEVIKLSVRTPDLIPRSVGDICDASPLADIDVCRTLWAFRVLGVVRQQAVMKTPARLAALDDDGLGMILAGE